MCKIIDHNLLTKNTMTINIVVRSNKCTYRHIFMYAKIVIFKIGVFVDHIILFFFVSRSTFSLCSCGAEYAHVVDIYFHILCFKCFFTQ